jgi:hypothetical protein
LGTLLACIVDEQGSFGPATQSRPDFALIRSANALLPPLRASIRPKSSARCSPSYLCEWLGRTLRAGPEINALSGLRMIVLTARRCNPSGQYTTCERTNNLSVASGGCEVAPSRTGETSLGNPAGTLVSLSRYFAKIPRLEAIRGFNMLGSIER